MGQVWNTGTVGRIFLSQLYCRKLVTLSSVTARYVNEQMLQYAKDRDEGDRRYDNQYKSELWQDAAMSLEVTLLPMFLNPERDLLPDLPKKHPFRAVCKQLGGPIILPTFSSFAQMKSFGAYISGAEDWGYSDDLCKGFVDIHWTFGPGWRMKMSSIPYPSANEGGILYW